MLFLGTLLDGLEMGLAFAILALGLYVSYTILDFPDLSVDSVFPLGGAVCSVLMLRLGMPPLVAVLLSFFVGSAVGAVTGFLHVKGKISPLLSGIIVMTALLSVNLALTKLLSKNGYTTTIFSFKSADLSGLFGGKAANLFGKEGKDGMIVAILLVFVIAAKLLLDGFFKTRLGYLLRATGENPRFPISVGLDPGRLKIFGLSFAGGFTALSGALYSNLYSSFDVTSGSGKVVMALASVIIGMALFSRRRGIKDTTAVIFGALLYSLCLNMLVLIDKEGIYLKLLNAVLFALILIFNDKLSELREKTRKKTAYELPELGSDPKEDTHA